MSASEGRGFEPWAWLGFFLCALALGLTLYLGLRPGGRGPVEAYRFGPLILGALAALLLLGSLAWGAFRRPLLQRGRLKVWLALAACLWWCSYPFPYPSSHEGHPSSAAFRLPFEGEWRVSFAGDRPRENPLVLTPPTRFGVAFQREEAALVLAPTRADVVAIDAARSLPGRVTLVLAIETGDTLELGGLDAASVTLTPGAPVDPGDPLGRTDVLTVFLHDDAGEGIPLRFEAYLADDRAVERGQPRKGQRVRSAPKPSPY